MPGDRGDSRGRLRQGAEIEKVTDAFTQSRIEAADGHVALLRAYVEANVALVGEHPAAVRALIDIARNVPAQRTGVNQRVAVFEEHFRSGQEAGADQCQRAVR